MLEGIGMFFATAMLLFGALVVAQANDGDRPVLSLSVLVLILLLLCTGFACFISGIKALWLS